MNREECLNKAKECVTSDRQRAYGSPENNFLRIAKLWNIYLDFPNQITPVDVAAMLALLKIARISSGSVHEDNWVDIAGYAACGCELQTMLTMLEDNERALEKYRAIWGAEIGE